MARIVVDEMPRFEEDCPFARPLNIKRGTTGRNVFVCSIPNDTKSAICNCDKCEWLVPFMTSNDMENINALLEKFIGRK